MNCTTFLRRSAIAAAIAIPVGTGLFAAPASAKTSYSAALTDARGDAKPSARDLVRGTVRYNSKTGTLSAKLIVAANYASSRADAAVVASISDTSTANCSKVAMSIGVQLSNPTVALAWRGTTPGKQRWYGTGRIHARTLTMRVQTKQLAGRTPACTAAFVTTTANSPSIIDETAVQRAFS
ncbi:MAG: hypothetical protein QM679_06035 [Patulibacter sp.]